ncbi:MAG: hypothetical protein R3249_02145 [Nitriliruptorales bacterium]|nr:hypothetical protein [Nitriliruptorales bacterium]
MQRSRFLPVAIAAALVLTACGDGGDDPVGDDPTSAGTVGSQPDDTGTGTEAALVQAATDQWNAFTDRDRETWFGTLSRACRERLGFARVGDWFNARHNRIDLAGIAMSDLVLVDVIVSGDGSAADVTLDITGTSETFREMVPNRWVFEEGGWFMDSCADIGEGQGQLEGFGTDRNNPAGFGGVIDVNGWLIALRHIEPDGEELMIEFGADPPAAGNQLFYVEVSIDYNGAEPSIVVGDELAFALLDGDTVLDGDPACGSDDRDVFYDPSAVYQPGGDGNFEWICQEIAPSQASSLMLRVEHLPTGGHWWYRLDGS